MVVLKEIFVWDSKITPYILFWFSCVILVSYYLIEYAYGVQLTYFSYIILGSVCILLLTTSKKLTVIDYWVFFLCLLVFVCLLCWQIYFKHRLELGEITHQFSNLVLIITGYLFSTNYSYSIDQRNIPRRMPTNIYYLMIFLFVCISLKMQDLMSISLIMRLGGADANPVGLAYSISLVFILVLGIIDKRNKLIYVVLVLFLFQLFILLFFTGSRGAILLISAVCLGLLIIKKKWPLLSVVIVLFITSIVIGMQGEYIVFSRFENLFNFLSNRKDLAVGGRLAFYSDVSSNFYAYILNGKDYYVDYPHNIILEFLLRFGLVIGSALFTFLLVPLSFVTVNFKAFIKKDPACFIMVIFFLFSFFYAFISLSLDLNKALWLSVGFIYGVMRNNEFRLKIKQM